MESVDDNDPERKIDDIRNLEKKMAIADREKEIFTNFDRASMLMEMDTDAQVMTFEELCMTDPFPKDTSFDLAKIKVYQFNLDKEIYPYPKMIKSEITESLKSKGRAPPPKAIFMPNRLLIRTMIKTCVEYGQKENMVVFFRRFGLIYS